MYLFNFSTVRIADRKPIMILQQATGKRISVLLLIKKGMEICQASYEYSIPLISRQSCTSIKLYKHCEIK